MKYEGSRPICVVEKPNEYVSNHAVVGLYCFPPVVVDATRRLERSARGEYEIADLINYYMAENRAQIKHIDEKLSWKDMGTLDDLLKTSNSVAQYQNRTSQLLGSIEYTLLMNGMINKCKLRKYLINQPRSAYFNNLRSICV